MLLWADSKKYTSIVSSNGAAGTLSPESTFTRASAGWTYVNGVLTVFAADVPRFGDMVGDGAYTGLVLEGAATNLLLQSDTLGTTWVVVGTTITANTTAAPDGTTTADTLARTSLLANYITQGVIKAASAIQYTYSIFVNRTSGTATYVGLRAQGAYPARVDACYRVSTNAIVSSSATTFTGLTTGVKTVNANWSRVWLTFTTDTAVAIDCTAAPLTHDGQIDDVDASSDATCMLWRAQLETGAFMTSPIPTTTAAVTRAADVCSIASLTTKPWFNPLQGTIVSDCKVAGLSTIYQTAYGISDGTVTNGVYLRVRGDNSQLEAAVLDTTTQAALTLANPAVVNTAYKVASAYLVNSFAAVTNGDTVQTDSSGTVPASLPTFYIGDAGAGNRNFNGVIKSITYYPSRFPNATLQSLTA